MGSTVPTEVEMKLSHLRQAMRAPTKPGEKEWEIEKD